MGDKPQTPNLPSKPNGNGVPEPDQALRGDSRLDGRFPPRVTRKAPTRRCSQTPLRRRRQSRGAGGPRFRYSADFSLFYWSRRSPPCSGSCGASSGCAHRSARRSQGPLHRARHRGPDIIAQLDHEGSSTVRSCSISRSCSKVTAQRSRPANISSNRMPV